MKLHFLKTWPDAFVAIVAGLKTAEFRKDDRGYEVGHRLILQEWDPETAAGYTGRDFGPLEITDIRRGGRFGIPEGFAMLSFRRSEGVDRERVLEGALRKASAADSLEQVSRIAREVIVTDQARCPGISERGRDCVLSPKHEGDCKFGGAS